MWHLSFFKRLEGVVLALNGAVVLGRQTVSEGDRVEIVYAVGGG